MERAVTVTAVLLALAVVLAGCGATQEPAGDGGTTTATTATGETTTVDGSTTATTTTTAPTTTTAESETSTATDGAEHVGCQPGELEKDGECTPVLSGSNADIFDATDLVAITTAETTVDGTPGYLARPAENGTYPAVVMIHEWWGLNDNIRHMADVLAGHGYVVFAVDLYDGEVTTNASRAGELAGQVRDNPEEAVAKMSRAVSGLRAMPYTTDAVASLGWCFGGGQSLQLSLSDADLNATVVYYGSLVTDAETLQRVDGPVLGVFGAEDTSIPVATVREFDRTLDEVGVDHEIHVYEGAPHAFANPSGERFHPEATRDAWAKTLRFLEESLRD
ncbi:dienelactone hydrolase family protein [Halobium salinum]|uniref:Dienelactone hydrolase family protein n=1 Tax=Halobium salinum TaxID=1364940 RepID=A0ABD5PER1_9EURY|nr:dienelactone hydrolase family protein [Halobium salinum]